MYRCVETHAFSTDRVSSRSSKPLKLHALLLLSKTFPCRNVVSSIRSSSVCAVVFSLSTMIITNALLQTAFAVLFSCAALADMTCDPNCPAPFPPGRGHIGNAWWVIGNERYGAYIAKLTTDLVIPRKPEGVVGIRTINPALDNSVSVHDLV